MSSKHVTSIKVAQHWVLNINVYLCKENRLTATSEGYGLKNFGVVHLYRYFAYELAWGGFPKRRSIQSSTQAQTSTRSIGFVLFSFILHNAFRSEHLVDIRTARWRVRGSFTRIKLQAVTTNEATSSEKCRPVRYPFIQGENDIAGNKTCLKEEYVVPDGNIRYSHCIIRRIAQNRDIFYCHSCKGSGHFA